MTMFDLAAKLELRAEKINEQLKKFDPDSVEWARLAGMQDGLDEAAKMAVLIGQGKFGSQGLTI